MPWIVVVFMAVDIVARLPGIGHFLRDCGVPLLSLIGLMWAGAVILAKGRHANSPGLILVEFSSAHGTMCAMVRGVA